MKQKKYDYYKLNVGFYPDVVKLCFSDAVFQQILKDHGVSLKANALDTGAAETHQIGDGKQGIIILVFNLDESGDNTPEIFDTIAHEVSHAVDHLAEFIGEEDGIKGETRAYLTGSLVKQIFKIYEHEKEKHVRKTSRVIPKQKGQRGWGPELQVDQLCVGSTGQVSLPLGQNSLSRTQDFDWQDITKADSGFFPIRPAGIPGKDTPK